MAVAPPGGPVRIKLQVIPALPKKTATFGEMQVLDGPDAATPAGMLSCKGADRDVCKWGPLVAVVTKTMTVRPSCVGAGVSLEVTVTVVDVRSFWSGICALCEDGR
jgi:hypothetical protein